MPVSNQAGAPGFEPRSTAPKAGVLPLHHAPVRGTLYHSDACRTMSLLFERACIAFQGPGPADWHGLAGRQAQLLRFFKRDDIRAGWGIGGLLYRIIPEG